MTIYLENISKSYGGVNVLNDFNVNIEDGKCYAFIGPEGSGKSTVLKIFMGTEKPDSGKVSRMGDYKYPTLQTAYVPQEDDLQRPKKLVVFGLGNYPKLISYYIETTTAWDIVCYTVDAAYISDATFEGRDVVAFEDITALYPPDE